jgi:hypothetical protein
LCCMPSTSSYPTVYTALATSAVPLVAKSPLLSIYISISSSSPLPLPSPTSSPSPSSPPPSSLSNTQRNATHPTTDRPTDRPFPTHEHRTLPRILLLLPLPSPNPLKSKPSRPQNRPLFTHAPPMHHSPRPVGGTISDRPTSRLTRPARARADLEHETRDANPASPRPAGLIGRARGGV